MVHKPKHKVHSFQGLLSSDGQDEINLERQDMNVAYRIVKFEILPKNFGTADYEAVVQIWKESQDTPTNVIDFTLPDLLGAACWSGASNVTGEVSGRHVIFENSLFSRNIYVTQKDTQSGKINYYIEIEEVPVAAATLMQIKLGTARKLIGGSMGK